MSQRLPNRLPDDYYDQHYPRDHPGPAGYNPTNTVDFQPDSVTLHQRIWLAQTLLHLKRKPYWKLCSIHRLICMWQPDSRTGQGRWKDYAGEDHTSCPLIEVPDGMLDYLASDSKASEMINTIGELHKMLSEHLTPREGELNSPVPIHEGRPLGAPERRRRIRE